MANMTLLADDSLWLEILLSPEKVNQDALPSLWLLLACGLVGAAAFGWLFKTGVKRLMSHHAPDPRAQADFGVSGLEVCALVAGSLVAMQLAAILAPQFAAARDIPVFIDPNAEKKEFSVVMQHVFIVFGKCALALVALFFILYKAQKQSPLLGMFLPGGLFRRAWAIVPMYAVWIVLACALGLAGVAAVWLSGSRVQDQKILEAVCAPSDWRAIAFAAIIVVTPIGEEFVFRAGIQGWLRRHFSFKWATLITLVPWVAAHCSIAFQPHILFTVAGLGLALGWVYERTGNIWYPIAFHAIHNGLTLAAYVYLLPPQP